MMRQGPLATRASSGLRQHLGPRSLLVLEFALLIAAAYFTRWLSIYVWKLPNGDVTLYYNYALSFWTQPPFLHHLPVEYPPLAVLPFTLTLIPPFIQDFQALYAVWMGALFVAGYIAFLRRTQRRRAVIYAVYMLVGGAATLLARFDIVPALVTLAALWAAERRRFGPAYVLLAAGILLKLYPVFLLPVFVLAQWQAATERARADGRAVPEFPAGWWRAGPRAALRRVWSHPAAARVVRGAGLCLGITALGFLAAMALNPVGAFSGFFYAGDRPLQIESTPATLLWLGTLVGIPAHADYSFVSLNYVGPLDALLKPLSAAALLGGCLWVYWRQARGRLTLGQAVLACLCAVIVTNKVFSPQYLIWILPVVAAVDGVSLAWLAICVLTTLNFPILYQLRHPIWTVPYTPEFLPVLALRNGLLIYVTLRAILRPAPQSAHVSHPAAEVATPFPARQPEDEPQGAEPALAR